MRPFSILIKPTSADCNMHCDYCFYFDHYIIYPETQKHRMNNAVLEKVIQNYMETDQPVYSFNWQGGEPTLMGIDFFRKIVHLQKKYGRSGAIVANSIQTNGTLLDKRFAQHFVRYNYLVGVSVDGPRDIHDYYRKFLNGHGSYNKVMENITILKSYSVQFNILTLVNNRNVSKAKEIYRFFRDQRFLYQQYIPCVEFDSNGKPLPYTISGELWGDFLCELFDEWYKYDVSTVSIRLFDSILTYLVDGNYMICSMGRNCNQYFVLEYNGDIYPCDFFVQKDLRLGNVALDSWEEFQVAQKYKDFGTKKIDWNHQCSGCPYQMFCNGDCLKHRMYSGNSAKSLSWLCSGWKKFYKHALPFFKKLAKEIKAERSF